MSAMTCTCGKPVPDHRAHVGYCSGECFESAVFWAIIAKPLEAMLREADATVSIADSPCRRCSGGKVRTCAACLAEIATERTYADEDDDVDVWRDSGVDPHTGGTYRGTWGP